MYKPFVIRPYCKYELARMYFPQSRKTKTAVANLRNMINRCRALRTALDAAGFRPTDKMFTPRQVRLIVEYVGEPYSEG